MRDITFELIQNVFQLIGIFTKPLDENYFAFIRKELGILKLLENELI